jgi:hypothetical protein
MSAMGDEDPPSLVELRRELAALQQQPPADPVDGSLGSSHGDHRTVDGGEPSHKPRLDGAPNDDSEADLDPAGDMVADPAVIPELDRLARRLTELSDEAGTADRETIWSRIEAQLGPSSSDEQA